MLKRFISLLLCIGLLAPAAACAYPPMPGAWSGTGTSFQPLKVNVNLGLAQVVYATPGTYTTNDIVATASGGTAPYTYLWTRQTGAANPTINSATASTVNWTAAVASPIRYTPTWLLTVTDAAQHTIQTTVQVSFTPTPGPLSVTIAPTTVTTSYASNGTITSAAVTANPINGHFPFTYQWAYVSGSNVPTANTATAKSTTFSAAAVAPNNYNSVWSVTVTDSTLATATATIPVAFNSTTLPLSVSLSSGTATASYTNSGTVTSSSITATPSGGLAPFTYQWAYSTGSSTPVANTPTSATTTWNTAAVAPNTYNANWNLTVTDANSNTASAPATVAITYNTGASDPLATLHHGIVTDNVVQTLNWYPSSNQAPYTRSSVVPYTTADFQNMKNAGITYIRIPIDVQQVLPGIPFAVSTLVFDKVANNYKPMSTNSTKVPDGAPHSTPNGPLQGSAGCGNLFVSNACSVEFTLEYLDQVIANANSVGLAVDLVIFAPSGASGGVEQPSACNPSPCPGVPGNLHLNMYNTPGLYGYATFEDMLKAANLVLVDRYATQYPLDTQLFWEPYNEPDYKKPGIGNAAYQLYTQWTNNTNGGAQKTIVDAIRAEETALGVAPHWIISDGISSAKAEWFSPDTGYQGMVPLADTKVVYSFHKYDPPNLFDQTAGYPPNPLYIYPAIGSGGAAMGRPGNVMPSTIPSISGSGPTYGNPIYNTAVDTSATPCFAGGPTPIYLAGQTLTGLNQMQACVKPNGAGNPTLWDYYNNNGDGVITKDWLLNDSKHGIINVINWAKAGGHDLSLGAPAVLKIIDGEIGAVCYVVDYRSCRQYYADAKSLLDSTGVPGGQSYIPIDWWAFVGGTFGLRPKNGGNTYADANGVKYNRFCLATSGVLKGYDIDLWNQISTPTGTYDLTSTPTGSTTLQCSGNQYGTPGLP